VLEHAIHLIENLLESVDDSDGELGVTLAQAQLTHAEACEQANLDPAELAARLATWALHSDWEVFLESPSTHAKALGAEGLDSFEAMVDEHFAQLPQLRAGEDDRRSQKPSRFTITDLKKQLASRRGADALVEVLSCDLSIAYRYLGIATVLADDGREEEALQWLDRSQRQKFGGHPDTRLRDFAADLHRQTGHVDLATQLVADGFAEFPTVSRFDRLRDFAMTSGIGRPAGKLRCGCFDRNRLPLSLRTCRPTEAVTATVFSSKFCWTRRTSNSHGKPLNTAAATWTCGRRSRTHEGYFTRATPCRSFSISVSERSKGATGRYISAEPC